MRFVVHFSLCDSLEAYYQEAGRAGRDGKRSYAVMLTAHDDAERIAKIFKSEFPPIADIKRIYELVCNYLQVAIGDGQGASFLFNIYDFCHKARLSVNNVINALKILEHNDIMTLVAEQDNPAKMMFCCSRDSLYKLNVEGNDMDLMLRTILRMYNGIFTIFRTINEDDIASQSGLKRERVHDLMKILWRMNIIRYIPGSHSPMILFNVERLPVADINIAPKTYHDRYTLAFERFDNMLRYATNRDECRSVIIEKYFGSVDAEPCGVCDVCLSRHKRGAHENLEERILNMLKESELSVKEVVSKFTIKDSVVVEQIDKMCHEGKISITSGGKLKIIE